MIVGLLRPTSGSIYYGNINQKDLNIISFRDEISYISQKYFNLLTIKDNILMGKERSSEKIFKQ